MSAISDLNGGETITVLPRTNSEWLSALRSTGSERQAAIEDLRTVLVRGLRFALASYDKVRPSDIEDFAQDALLRILDKLDTFEGRSRFTTWAHKVAIHVALTELRRRRWRDVPLLPPKELSFDQDAQVDIVDDSANPEQRAIQQALLRVVGRTIAEDLTERQRQALTAIVLQGMPLEQVAERMDTNTNALYKLLHDARKRLKQRLIEAGLPPEEIMASFEEPA